MKIEFILINLSIIGIVSCMIVHLNPIHKTFKKVSEKTENDNKLHKNNNLNEKNTNSKIKNAQNLFMCIVENCYSIQEYRILPENTFSCHEKNILIELISLRKYNLTDGDGIYGYLTQHRTIFNDQELTDICTKIKRYYINDNQVLLVIFNSENIHIVENFKANEIILSELFKSWSFIIWFAFKFDYYIEKSDVILYGEFVKDVVFYSLVVILIYKLLIKIACAYCCLSDIMEKKSNNVFLQQVTALSKESATGSVAQSQPICENIGLQALVRRRGNNNP